MRVIVALAVTVVGAFGTIVPAGAQTGQEEAICRTDPNVFFCENFEDRPLGILAPGVPGYKNGGYGVSGNPTVQTDEKFDGTRAIRLDTPANQVSGGAFDTSFKGQRTVFWRWYGKYSPNWIWSPVATKHNETFTCCFTGQHGLIGAVQDNGIFNFANNTGTRTPVITYLFARTGQGNLSDVYFTQNMNPLNQLNVNQWYCFEARITMNTGITAQDGYIQAWIDGVQRMEYPNVNVVDIPNPVTSGFFFPSYWNCDGNENCSATQYQHPTMYRYMDNIIGSTQRIGCLSSANNPPTVPSAPLQPSAR